MDRISQAPAPAAPMATHESIEDLRAALAESQREVQELSAELEETNRGVVALYSDLEAQAEQLQKATEMKSRFLAYMSHEFRTPINSIRSIARLLAEHVDGPLNTEQSRQVGFIQSTASEFADMVDDLLDLAKIEAGRVEISPAWFDMLDLFQALRGMFRPVLTNPDVNLFFDEPKGLAPLYTDDRKLSQILRNFISNALKFTPRGEVRVSVETVDSDRVRFSVADTGIGIAPEFHSSVFDDYTQIGSSLQKRLRGTGLGLAVSRQLAELLGGTVTLESALGAGSVFSLTLPLRLPGDDASAPPGTAPRTASMGNGMQHVTAIHTTIDRAAHTVLVVDDNPITRYSTVRVVRAAGFQTVEADNGTEAIRLAATDVSAVVLDVHLPDIDGFEVCRVIRQQEGTALLPVMHLSAAHVHSEDRVTGLNAGADAYLTHPVEPALLVGTLQALIRARMAEDGLRRSDRRFRAIYSQALAGIGLIQPDGRFTDVNPAMVRLLDRSRDELLGHPISDFAPPGWLDFITEKTVGGERGEPWQGEFPLQRPDGAWVYLEWSISAHVEPGLRMAIAADISERMELDSRRQDVLEREQAARATAERLSRTKDDFIAVLSHELRTPLNAIAGWVHILKRRGGTPELLKGLDSIHRNVKAQARIISDILDVSRINSGKLHLEREWIDPVESVRASIDALQASIAEKRLDVALAVQDANAPAWLDPTRFQQIFWNLLTNAIKFSNDGARIDVVLRREKGQLTLSVRDYGRGIASEFIDHLFDRFTQSDSPDNRRHGGLGLGLSIVKQLAELHGGRATAVSAGLDQGTTMQVTLPVDHKGGDLARAVSQGDDAPADPPMADRPLAGLDILIVEDHPDAREMLTVVLADGGARLREAGDYEAAMRALAERWPDVLVCDIGLPGRDGYDLVRSLRSLPLPSCKAQPIAVALTAFARAQDAQRALEAGFDAHLGKPLQPHALMATINRLVDSR